ncbi:MAG: tRNA (adenosine(37)-N6)-threonylcarbamoyltransferase complex ATPase subunit type 1 TsaE [Simkaniaceae bacterium]|nr:tRNA (adenosine(37)-N6)-threonylcarbamoyltransferase complex ATPase subunit type 1 TsaE [Simkaniaceae bacterium]
MSKDGLRKIVSTLADVPKIASLLATRANPGAVFCFSGPPGAGKTTLIKTLVAKTTGIDETEVTSPTFTYLHIYEGSDLTCFHFDLYRCADHVDFLAGGFDEYFDAGGICCIEWAERIAPLIPEGAVRIDISHENERTREVRITGL